MGLRAGSRGPMVEGWEFEGWRRLPRWVCGCGCGKECLSCVSCPSQDLALDVIAIQFVGFSLYILMNELRMFQFQFPVSYCDVWWRFLNLARPRCDRWARPMSVLGATTGVAWLSSGIAQISPAPTSRSALAGDPPHTQTQSHTTTTTIP